VDQILVVIDGKTPELAEAAAQHLADKLKERPDLYQTVVRPDGGHFFNQNALLFMPAPEIQKSTEELLKARPLLAELASDPSLRGVITAVAFTASKARARTGNLDAFDQPMAALSDALDDLLSGRRPFMSWRTLLTGKAPRRTNCASSLK
jgi:hypothetical protein